MAGLEHQVHILSAQLQRLRFENSSLLNQNDLLSKVLAMKEGQLSVLRHEAKAKGEDSTSTDVKPCPPCSMRSVLGQQGAIESASMYTAEVVMKMSIDDVCQKYKEYAQRLSELLLLVDKPGGSPEGSKEINQILADLSELLSKLVLLKPEYGAMFVGRNFEFGCTELPNETEAQKATEGLLRCLELKDEQQERVVALYRQFRTNMQRIRERRRHLNNQLQSQLLAMEGEYVPGLVMHRLAKASVQMEEVIQQLKSSVDSERFEYSNLCAAFFAVALTTLQAARIFVRSYPHYPDVMGLAMLVVQSVKEDPGCESDATGAST
ncbi:unnamed protein product [Ostreobium quekettii]|uniref:Uncharacterized protein n=1 Tax=Ostreobium quekettii TaxID=121088 RepID=A0A8S1JA67_9CHLO|nr:unnamed protein product [Ostreobium quekettii]